MCTYHHVCLPPISPESDDQGASFPSLVFCILPAPPCNILAKKADLISFQEAPAAFSFPFCHKARPGLSSQCAMRLFLFEWGKAHV